MPLRSSHRRSGEWRLPHASYWPGPAHPHIQGFPASDRDCGWWFLRFRRQDRVPFVRSATSCGMGARMQRRRRPAAAQLPHGLLKLAISSKVLSSDGPERLGAAAERSTATHPSAGEVFPD
ncbi:hypothetical protein PVAP13_3KG380081 [Panicum virgatum]|uniref:Uncharacterized protein n=1 Tax=Panicum virgatum TaxID=38727 RepID=A0A8T0UVM2_PANVG|nr:hypothetical protein PVAP13_3KG380081 [Panicum virgatum]